MLERWNIRRHHGALTLVNRWEDFVVRVEGWNRFLQTRNILLYFGDCDNLIPLNHGNAKETVAWFKEFKRHIATQDNRGSSIHDQTRLKRAIHAEDNDYWVAMSGSGNDLNLSNPLFVLSFSIILSQYFQQPSAILSYLFLSMVKVVETSCVHDEDDDATVEDEYDESGIYARVIYPEFIGDATPAEPRISDYFGQLLHHECAEKVNWVYQAIKYAGKFLASCIPAAEGSSFGGIRHESPYVGDTNLGAIGNIGMMLVYALAMKRNDSGHKKIQESEIKEQMKVIEREYKTVYRKKLFTELQYCQLRATYGMLRLQSDATRVIRGIHREGMTALSPLLDELIKIYGDLINITNRLGFAKDQSLLTKYDSLEAFRHFISSHPDCSSHEFERRYYKFLDEYISINNKTTCTKRVSQARLEKMLERVNCSLNEDVADLRSAHVLAQDHKKALAEYDNGELSSSDLMATFKQSAGCLERLSHNLNLRNIGESELYDESWRQCPQDMMYSEKRELSGVSVGSGISSGFAFWQGLRKPATNAPRIWIDSNENQTVLAKSHVSF